MCFPLICFTKSYLWLKDVAFQLYLMFDAYGAFPTAASDACFSNSYFVVTFSFVFLNFLDSIVFLLHVHLLTLAPLEHSSYFHFQIITNVSSKVGYNGDLCSVH